VLRRYGKDKYIRKVEVTKLMLQPYGRLHGGISAWLAEEAGSFIGTAHLHTQLGPELKMDTSSMSVVGLNVSMSHLSAAYEGDQLYVVVTKVHAGRRTMLWKIDLYVFNDPLDAWNKVEDVGKIVASGSLTLMVINKAEQKKSGTSSKL
jgi:1,4-dihydroxy-2-naphthoyl-CoA hydrolase